jgi:hypothetical protein
MRGSAGLSASPVPTSLVTFLFGDKKVTSHFYATKTGYLGIQTK